MSIAYFRSNAWPRHQSGDIAPSAGPRYATAPLQQDSSCRMALEFALIVAAVVSCGLLLLVLFEPGLPYRVEAPVDAPDSREFLRLVGAITDSDVHDAASVAVLTDGDAFLRSGARSDSRSASQRPHRRVHLPSERDRRSVSRSADRARASRRRRARDRRRDRQFSDARPLLRDIARRRRQG